MAPPPVLRHDTWVDPRPIRTARREVEKVFDSVSAQPERQSMVQAAKDYLRTGQAGSFRDLKYTCFGITLALDKTNTRIVDKGDTFERLLREVDQQRTEARRFLRCYQALLQGYFAFAPEPESNTAAMQATPAFTTLRAYLSERLEIVARPVAGGRVPGWVLTLKEHENLLRDHPCRRYTAELGEGRTDQLAEVCNGLGINRESWVWQEVILAYLNDVCGREDVPFKAAIPTALDLAEGRTSLHPSPTTTRLVVSKLVKRYSEAVAHPEQPRLRDASLECIGNPWIRRIAWDKWVAHEPARQMVDGWLKTRLMEDFFSLLADQGGGAVDARRLKYWLKYVHLVEDMWFILGVSAYDNHTVEFSTMRQRMKGRLKELTGGPPQNNAFVMRIGGYLFIEYGMTGNACYIYPVEQQPFNESNSPVSIHTLKKGAKKLTHMHAWEHTFDTELRRLLGSLLTAQSPVRRQSAGQSTQGTVGAPRAANVGAAPPNPTDAITQSSGRTGLLPTAPVPTQKAGLVSADSLHIPRFLPDRGENMVKLALAMCNRAGIIHKDLAAKSGGTWVHEQAKHRPEIRFALERAGFNLSDVHDRRGYWKGTSVSLEEGVPASAQEVRLGKLLKQCDAHFVRHEDLRAKGGSLWVYTDPIRHDSLVGMLIDFGFRFSARRNGYYIDGE
jgi:hypothetical protein